MELKFLLCVAILWKELDSFPQGLRKNALQKVFKSISEVLASQNHKVSVVGEFSPSDLIMMEAFAEIPHVVVSLDYKKEVLAINSSAILFLNSIETLEFFNNQT